MVAAEKTHDVFGLVGQVLDGRFEITRVVAEGGFGVVYQGHQTALDRPVAVKALKLDDAPGKLSSFRERFAAEAKTMARLRHPNIADVYDSGITRLPSGADLPWIALEWLEGDTLEAILEVRRGSGGLPPAQALELMRPALQAIAYAHRQGVAHRDIKPGNMIRAGNSVRTMDGGGPTLQVLDFGISKIMAPDETAGSGRTRTSGGYSFSPAYASPEQISAGRSGPWTDVHALGLVLTEVLTDKPPVEDAATEIELYARLLSEDRPTPASKGKDLGPWEGVIARAMALQPSQRWKDAGELLDALNATVSEAERAARAAGARPLNTKQRVAATIVRPEPARPAVAAPAAGSDTLERPAGSRRWLVALVLGAAVAAGALALWSRREPAPEAIQQAVPAQVSPALPAAAPAPTPAQPPPVETSPPAAAALPTAEAPVQPTVRKQPGRRDRAARPGATRDPAPVTRQAAPPPKVDPANMDIR